MQSAAFHRSLVPHHPIHSREPRTHSEKEQNVELNRFAESMKGFYGGIDVISEEEIVFDKSLKIPSKSSIVLELKEELGEVNILPSEKANYNLTR